MMRRPGVSSGKLTGLAAMRETVDCVTNIDHHRVA
jgi:hypothetical protein